MTTVRKIAATEATIRTAAIEIRTLTVRDKQVTLALFRQLPSDTLIDYATGQLRGVPWGYVRYDIKEAAWNTHVVWQLGDALRRQSLPLDGDDWRKKSWCRIGHQIDEDDGVRGYDTFDYAASVNPMWAIRTVRSGQYHGAVSVSDDGVAERIVYHIPDDVKQLRFWYPEPTQEEIMAYLKTPIDAACAEWDQNCRKLCDYIRTLPSDDTFMTTIRNIITVRKARYETLVSLTALPQLFIAV